MIRRAAKPIISRESNRRLGPFPRERGGSSSRRSRSCSSAALQIANLLQRRTIRGPPPLRPCRDTTHQKLAGAFTPRATNLTSLAPRDLRRRRCEWPPARQDTKDRTPRVEPCDRRVPGAGDDSVRECRGLDTKRPRSPARSCEPRAKGRRRMRVTRAGNFFARPSERSVQGRAVTARRLCSAGDLKLRRDLLRQLWQTQAVRKRRWVAPVRPLVFQGTLARAPLAAFAQGGCVRFLPCLGFGDRNAGDRSAMAAVARYKVATRLSRDFSAVGTSCRRPGSRIVLGRRLIGKRARD